MNILTGGELSRLEEEDEGIDLDLISGGIGSRMSTGRFESRLLFIELSHALCLALFMIIMLPLQAHNQLKMDGATDE